MISEEKILGKIDETKQAISAAEGELQRLVGEIQRLPRAEKTTITTAVREAFARLDEARVKLVELEVLANSE
jgi:uncharacterized protein (UPF0335 family)